MSGSMCKVRGTAGSVGQSIIVRSWPESLITFNYQVRLAYGNNGGGSDVRRQHRKTKTNSYTGD